MTRSFGSCTFELVQGDITRVEVDAIVNAANTELAGGGGVDGVIHRAGGPTLMEELKAYPGCPTGSAVVTGGGRLPCRYVFHAVGPIWRGGKANEVALLAGAYRTCLEHAHRLGVKSLAFPAISTGVYCFPLDQATRIALETCRDGCEGLERIVFACFSSGDLGVYKRELSRL